MGYFTFELPAQLQSIAQSTSGRREIGEELLGAVHLLSCMCGGSAAGSSSSHALVRFTLIYGWHLAQGLFSWGYRGIFGCRPRSGSSPPQASERRDCCAPQSNTCFDSGPSGLRRKLPRSRCGEILKNRRVAHPGPSRSLPSPLAHRIDSPRPPHLRHLRPRRTAEHASQRPIARLATLI
jgi:hypothetical protein